MNKKSVLISVIIIVILAMFGLFWYKQHAKNSKIDFGKPLASKERSLTKEARQIYYDRIKKAETDLNSLKPGDKNFHISRVNDYTYLGQQYFGLGELENSKRSYIQVLQIEPTNEAAMVGLAFTYADAGEFSLALTYLEKAKTSNPTNYNLWPQYIDLKKAAGAGNEEIAGIYEEALKATERHIDIITKYAVFLESAGKIKEAIGLWKEAAEKNPESAKIYEQEISRLSKL